MPLISQACCLSFTRPDSRDEPEAGPCPQDAGRAHNITREKVQPPAWGLQHMGQATQSLHSWPAGRAAAGRMFVLIPTNGSSTIAELMTPAWATRQPILSFWPLLIPCSSCSFPFGFSHQSTSIQIGPCVGEKDSSAVCPAV